MGAMADYQMDAKRDSEIMPVPGWPSDAVAPSASSMRRVKLSNWAASGVLPVSASGTPEFNAPETVL